MPRGDSVRTGVRNIIKKNMLQLGNTYMDPSFIFFSCACHDFPLHLPVIFLCNYMYTSVSIQRKQVLNDHQVSE